LGAYSATPGGGVLDISYTGPLLSDDLVHLVRNGIARGAHRDPSAVTVRASSSAGAGVVMADEPAPAPEPASAATPASAVTPGTGGDHDHG
jgi:hypothetical protein